MKKKGKVKSSFATILYKYLIYVCIYIYNIFIIKLSNVARKKMFPILIIGWNFVMDFTC